MILNSDMGRLGGVPRGGELCVDARFHVCARLCIREYKHHVYIGSLCIRVCVAYTEAMADDIGCVQTISAPKVPKLTKPPKPPQIRKYAVPAMELRNPELVMQRLPACPPPQETKLLLHRDFLNIVTGCVQPADSVYNWQAVSTCGA